MSALDITHRLQLLADLAAAENLSDPPAVREVALEAALEIEVLRAKISPERLYTADEVRAWLLTWGEQREQEIAASGTTTARTVARIVETEIRRAGAEFPHNRPGQAGGDQ